MQVGEIVRAPLLPCYEQRSRILASSVLPLRFDKRLAILTVEATGDLNVSYRPTPGHA